MKTHNTFIVHFYLTEYCGSGYIREVLILAMRTNSLIQDFRENYYYNSATNENSRILIFLKSLKIRNS